MNSKIAQLIQSRKQEAIDNEISKKVRSIVKFMGKKIITQGEFTYEEWELMTQEIFERDEDSRQIGWLFQAYPFGKEFEIQYLIELEMLTATWYGDKVYEEIEGNATAYVPGKWEDFLNSMYSISVEREERYLSQKEGQKRADISTKTNKFLDFLRKNWGISFNF